MKYIRRVDVFQAAEDLVDEGLKVSVGEGLARADDCSEIALHQLYTGETIVVSFLSSLPSNESIPWMTTYLRTDKSR